MCEGDFPNRKNWMHIISLNSRAQLMMHAAYLKDNLDIAVKVDW